MSAVQRMMQMAGKPYAGKALVTELSPAPVTQADVGKEIINMLGEHEIEGINIDPHLNDLGPRQFRQYIGGDEVNKERYLTEFSKRATGISIILATIYPFLFQSTTFVLTEETQWRTQGQEPVMYAWIGAAPGGPPLTTTWTSWS
jgi:hypothetical protein